MPESRADTVVVDYAGYIQETGRQFDAGESSTFGLSGVIDGFAEGILGMRVGGMRRIIIPPDLGYGSNGNSGAGIGGEDVIVFDVTLHEIK
ncbi:MAG: FKBP-type peptidyl-prolyl cis-trans isomerase [Phycisphaerales bacterium]|nr:FKBP-type peptidyl-prolyl cis-trans isomerase [Phycisphaerales bacterium]